MEGEIAGLLEKVELRDAFRRMFALSSVGNKKFQDGEPWKGVKENPQATASLIWNLVYLVRDLAILASPYVPQTAERIAGMLGIEKLAWADLGVLKGIEKVQKPDLLFARLEDKQIEALRLRFSGTQKEREAADAEEKRVPTPAEIAVRSSGRKWTFEPPGSRRSSATLTQRSSISRRWTLGRETRTIVSGLVPHYKEEELLGHTVVLVANLKPAMLRGVESQGMLLAAQEGKTVEVLFVDHAKPGERVVLQGGPAESSPIRDRHRHVLHHADRGRGFARARGGRRAGMRGQARDHGEGGEGQGEVIEVSVRPASLTDLDSSEELLQTGWWGNFKKAHGWNAHPFLVTVTPQDQGAQDQAGQTFGLLVLTRVLLRRFVIAYVPFGPTVDPKCGQREDADRAGGSASTSPGPAAHCSSGTTCRGTKRERRRRGRAAA